MNEADREWSENFDRCQREQQARIDELRIQLAAEKLAWELIAGGVVESPSRLGSLSQ